MMMNNKGITIIALVITIVLMLILASITINMTTNGGLFEYAGKAKIDIEIADEKVIITKASMTAKATSKTGKITLNELKKIINNITGENTAIVMDNGETVVVKFNDSNRYYEVDNKGEISGPIEMAKVDYAGDITKGGTCDGSKDNPYQISCIEDLVAFSIMTNGGNSELGLASNRFSNKYVEMTRPIDFKSIFSYNDYTTTIYGDLNTDGKVEDIRTELTKTEEGCIGFTGILNFAGIFDGKGESIENIYQNTTLDGGLFRCPNASYPASIYNLSLSGNITSTGWAGGICTNNAKTIKNCKNYANVTGYNMVGGIVSLAGNNSYQINIIDCENYGIIKSTGAPYAYAGTGGIVGCYRYGNNNTKNCVNYGQVIGSGACGGIIGCISGNVNAEIVNCINKGESNTGILNLIYSNSEGGVNLLNCCNLGEVTNCGIINNIRYNKIIINNCYNSGISSKAIAGAKSAEGEFIITNTYYDKTKSASVGVETEGIEALEEKDMRNNATFVQTLNNNIGTNTEWKRWKIGEDGWPTFE